MQRTHQWWKACHVIDVGRLILGVVAALLILFGLLMLLGPASVYVDGMWVDCGTAATQNPPPVCVAERVGRSAWAIPLTAAGVIGVLGAAVMGGRTRR